MIYKCLQISQENLTKHTINEVKDCSLPQVLEKAFEVGHLILVLR